jgi:hypothetical protein
MLELAKGFEPPTLLLQFGFAYSIPESAQLLLSGSNGIIP